MAGDGLAQAQLFLDIIIVHVHAQRLRQNGYLAAYMAVAHDAEVFIADLEGVAGRLDPLAPVGSGILQGHLRISMMHSAMTSSATDLVLEKGALNTGIPSNRAACRSTWLVPML